MCAYADFPQIESVLCEQLSWLHRFTQAGEIAGAGSTLVVCLQRVGIC